MLTYIDNTNGNVGAMVAYALEIGDEIGPNKSGFNRAGTISESYNVIVTLPYSNANYSILSL